jgi:hypothetical protein
VFKMLAVVLPKRHGSASHNQRRTSDKPAIQVEMYTHRPAVLCLVAECQRFAEADYLHLHGLTKIITCNHRN